MAANSKPIILAANIFETATPTATDTATGYDVLNILDRRTYTLWKAASFGTKYLTIDAATATAVDALGIIGHNLSTCSATISVEHSTTGLWAGEEVEILAGFTVTTDKAILKTFTSATIRYWRIKIVTAAIAPYIAVAFLGPRATFSRAMTINFDPFPEKLITETNRSKGGHILGTTIQYVSSEITAKFNAVATTWIEATFRDLWDDYLSQLKPVFWAWEITNHPLEIYYVTVPESFNMSMPYGSMGSSYRDLSLTFEAVKE